ncbi:MAG: HRDC domain-containing protein [Chloroflexi bacterium]|nr:HRDC domain-containing protein [Chloroflexota bacterium]
MPALPPPNLITTPDELARLAAELARQPILGVDTESNSLHAFRERVCLVQIATPRADMLIDALAVRDLSALAPVFASPDIEKIFHAAEYDLLTLKRDFGFTFANLFDTMLAARILGRPKIGLGDLLAEEFDVTQSKKYQRADWGLRPLPPEALEYAQTDIHYLISLRGRLKPQLEAAGRWPLAAEDFLRMAMANGDAPGSPEVNIWRITGVRDLSPQQCAILQRLAEYRYQRAEQVDLPLFKVIGDKTLIAIAQTEPASESDLKRIPGMSASQVRRHGRGLLRAVRQGQEDSALYPPRRPPYDEAFQNRLEALRLWRKTRARALEVESDIILPRDVLEAIARRNPAGRADLEEPMATLPWRLEQFGAEILASIAEARKESA